jgi:hypothetical protein
MTAPTDRRPARGDAPVPAATAPDDGRRVLGDAWRGWDAAGDASEAEIRAGAGLFIGLVLLLTLLGILAWQVLLWLAQPRLGALGMGPAALRGVSGAGTVAILLPGLLLLGIAAGLRVPRAGARWLQGAAVAIWPAAETAGRLLRIARDRRAHSYLQVMNRLALQAGRAQPGRALLLLAPRCLRRDLRFSLQALAGEFGAHCETVGGGEQARDTIARLRPAGVLAVACERDLVEGVRGVAPRVTVLSLPNRRPDGPCRNSEIDLAEARRLLARLQRVAQGAVPADSGA